MRVISLFSYLGIVPVLGWAVSADAFPLGNAAWSDGLWAEHCKDVRTKYNATSPLDTKALTIKKEDPRFLDFLYWVWANKIIEHQVEQVGGTGWKKADLDSILILFFTKVRGGAQITLVHVNVPSYDYAGVKKGWPKYYWTPWKAYLKRRSS